MKKPFVFQQSQEEEIEDFKAIAPSLVKDGALTRKQGEYGTSIDGVKDHLKPIAEEELKKQGK
jgi:hypothetical protein